MNFKPIPEMDPVQLLGRKPARLDQAAILKFIRGKRLLVTGAAGSVGSELTKQIAQLQPALLLAIDRAENPLFYFEAELQGAFPEAKLVTLVSDVTDGAEMSSLMARYSPQVVFHAAAYKHVPLMERAPREAVKNNVGGTYTVARCAREAGVEKFVLVSTDKAVKPSSVMGATKRLAEMVIMEMERPGSTTFLAVRFGNVLGSNASVVPIFTKQIAAGGPVTVTDRRATRYFMSLSEAAGLILQAAAIGTGNEIFLLDMGEPVSILTLAENMVRLAGLKPYEDIQIVFTGLRPGEKLVEELSYQWENFQPTAQEKLRVLRDAVSTGGILPSMEQLLDALPGLDGDAVKAWLGALVPEYRLGQPGADAPKGHGS